MTIERHITVLGVLELSSIAVGINVLDGMVKVAPVKILDARTICPGKYLIVFCGDVASAEYAFHKGLELSGKYIIDSMLLRQVHPECLGAIGNIKMVTELQAIGIIETSTVTAAIEAADIAAKESGVAILEVRLAIGFGGKSYMKLTGTLPDVQASIEAGLALVKQKNALCAHSLISQPHSEIAPFFLK
ncbi:MAG TPA: propanediol utilization protein [Bacteroidales bacterium]|nr:propanediol utilization protein [Bacteroidales bacterium]